MFEPIPTIPSMSHTGHRHPVTLALGLAVALSTTAEAAALAELHGFDYIPDGFLNTPYQYSEASVLLAQGRDGNLYGTLPGGGTLMRGTAFKLTPSGDFTKLHDFGSASEGEFPFGGLTLGTDGNFYGTTNSGGPNGGGTMFRMLPSGVITTLHSFGGFSIADGGIYPWAPPTQGRDGNLYGTTKYGGFQNLGTVYKKTPSGSLTTLFSFTYPQGVYPSEALIQGTDGAFYGTTQGDRRNFGSHDGTVFRITPAGVISTVYTFDYIHGSTPFGPLVQGTDGNLYGTTSSGGTLGGGVVFKLTLKGIITVLYNFDGQSAVGQTSGYTPFSGLVRGSNGNFYGATSRGGAGCGALFQITPTGVYTVQGSFDYINGCVPRSTPFVHTNGRIYGMTTQGGTWGNGTLYSLDVGAPGFVAPIPNAAKAGTSVGLLGAVGGTTGVTFNGTAASFSGTGNTYRTAVVPAGAATGLIKVTTASGSLQTLKAFQQLPTLTALSPAAGPVGSAVILTGTGLAQTTRVTFGGGKIASFVVNSAEQITATVPGGAITGKIAATTTGGSVSTATAFTVTP